MDRRQRAAQRIADKIAGGPMLEATKRVHTALNVDGTVATDAGRTIVPLQVFTFYRDGIQTVGNNIAEQITFAENMRIVRLFARVKLGPAGSSLIARVRWNGATTVGNITIPSGQTASGVSLSSLILIPAGQWIEADVTQIGSSGAGGSLTVQVFARPEIS